MRCDAVEVHGQSDSRAGSLAAPLFILCCTHPHQVVSFGVGIATAIIFLALVFDPFCVLVFGTTKTVTLKHAYFLFWGLLLGLGLIVFAEEGLIRI